MMKKTQIMPMTIIVILIVILCGIATYDITTSNFHEVGTITDIVSINPGGFLSADVCEIYIDGLKHWKSGVWCHFDINQTVCQRNARYFKEFVECEAGEWPKND